MAGKIVADQLEHSTAGSLDTQFVVNGSAKAFELHDGTSTTLQDSLNVSSLTDGGTGIQTVTFSNSMGSAIYVKSGSTGDESTSVGYIATTSYNAANTSSAFVYYTVNSAAAAIERNNHQSIVHGDLA